MQNLILMNPLQNSRFHNRRFLTQHSLFQLKYSPFQNHIDFLLQHWQKKLTVEHNSPSDGNSIYPRKLRLVDKANSEFISDGFPECP